MLTKDGEGNRIVYEGETFSIVEPEPDLSSTLQCDVHKVVELVYYWVSVSAHEELLNTTLSCLAG
jgi:hypothetical protein